MSSLNNLGNPTDWPAGMRNNNPGNIKFNSGINWVGQVGPSQNTDQGDPQVVFDSQSDGMRALVKNVLAKANDGVNTIQGLIAGSGGWTPGYEPGAQGVAKAAGIPADQPINLKDPDTMAAVVRGIVTQEHGPASSYYTDDMIRQGMALAGMGSDDQVPAADDQVSAYALGAPSSPGLDAIKSAMAVKAGIAPPKVVVGPAKPATAGIGTLLGNLVSAGKTGLANIQKLAATPSVQSGIRMGIMGSPQLMTQVMENPTLRSAAFAQLMGMNVGAAPQVVQGRQSVPYGTPAVAVTAQGTTPVTLVQTAGQARSDAQMPNPGNQNMAVYRANRAAIGGPIMQSTINQALANGQTLYKPASNGGGYSGMGGAVTTPGGSLTGGF